MAVEAAPEDLDYAVAVERGSQERHQGITMQEGLDARPRSGDGVGGDEASADDQVHPGFRPCSASALLARPGIPAPFDALFVATGPRGGLRDGLLPYSGTNLPDLGGTFAGVQNPAMSFETVALDEESINGINALT